MKKSIEVKFTEDRENKMGRPPKRPELTERKEGRGRPSKDDCYVRRFIRHPRSDMKDPVKYGKKVLKQVENIYKYYDRETPNPLNIEDKDLCDEARDAWKYVFSEREYTGKLPHGNTRDLDARETVVLFEIFCAYIRKKNFCIGFVRPDGSEGTLPIVPSQTNFARWLGTSVMKISRAMREYGTDEDRKNYKSILGDILSEGAMMGIYQPSMTMFSLKNLCDWADKYEDRPKDSGDTTLTMEEAVKLMETLGYRKELTDGQGTESTPND